MRDPAVFRPVFASQYPDASGPVDACGEATLINYMGALTTGESTDLPSGSVMSPAMLRRQRNRLQQHIGPSAVGGTTIDQLVAAAAKEWQYPPLQVERNIDWDALWADLEDGHSAALVGKLADAPAASPLRRWGGTGGHWITVLRAKGGQALIYNSLATSPSYNGDWVPEAHLKAFVYKTNNRVHQCLLDKAGGYRQSVLVSIEAQQRIKAVRREMQASIDALTAQVVPIEQARATARDDALRQAADAIEAMR